MPALKLEYRARESEWGYPVLSNWPILSNQLFFVWPILSSQLNVLAILSNPLTPIETLVPGSLRAPSFGTIPELEYLEWTVFVFFWELFRFRNERNIITFILLLIAE